VLGKDWTAEVRCVIVLRRCWTRAWRSETGSCISELGVGGGDVGGADGGVGRRRRPLLGGTGQAVVEIVSVEARASL
jgi:hypothetical protein